MPVIRFLVVANVLRLSARWTFSFKDEQIPLWSSGPSRRPRGPSICGSCGANIKGANTRWGGDIFLWDCLLRGPSNFVVSHGLRLSCGEGRGHITSSRISLIKWFQFLSPSIHVNFVVSHDLSNIVLAESWGAIPRLSEVSIRSNPSSIWGVYNE